MREHIKKDKGKKAMSLKDAEEEGSESDFNDTIHVTGSMIESSKKKKLKKFDLVIKDWDHVHLIKKQIKEQKRVKVSAKAEAAKHEVEVKREELVNLLGFYVVFSDYKAKLQYEKYYDKMLKGKSKSRITNCNVLTRKGPITLKVYKENVQYKDHPAGTALNEPILSMIMFNSYHMQDFITIKYFRDFSNEMLYIVQEIFFKLHQGPRIDDRARTFSSFISVKVDKRNLNPLNQIRDIEQLRQ
uniref:Uncharacterized protein n=1 Tax=Tanacetum cinerariifolium TaxID=118510 RepID=A0A699IP44_TANCI|nr:hypothetical protein [Tanacetum cinerariifolium]